MFCYMGPTNTWVSVFGKNSLLRYIVQTNLFILIYVLYKYRLIYMHKTIIKYLHFLWLSFHNYKKNFIYL